MIKKTESLHCIEVLQKGKIRRLIKSNKEGGRVFTTSITSECSTTITSI